MIRACGNQSRAMDAHRKFRNPNSVKQAANTSALLATVRTLISPVIDRVAASIDVQLKKAKTTHSEVRTRDAVISFFYSNGKLRRMATPFDNAQIEIRCAKCGNTFKKSIGELQSGVPFSCSCGNAFDPAEMAAKAQQAIETLKNKVNPK